MLFLEDPSQLMVPITDQSKLCHKYVNGYLKLSPDPTKEHRATTTHSHHIYQECAIFLQLLRFFFLTSYFAS